MIRFILTMIFYVLVAQWLYAEARILAPSVLPAINTGLDRLTIPTHDQWNWEAIERAFGYLRGVELKLPTSQTAEVPSEDRLTPKILAGEEERDEVMARPL